MTATPVPETLRPWAAAHPAYVPIDATPPELQPPALETPERWIVDTQATPTEITNWAARQADALVPFDVVGGWPLNPTGRTGRTGRDLGKWGENAAADPIVIAGAGADRRVLLIQRDDSGVWAIPGGMVDPGETAPAALVRELAEETGVDLTGREPNAILGRTYVADHRATDHAWVASTVGLYLLPETVEAQGADDARDARWVSAPNIKHIATTVEEAGGLHPAHQPLLAAALERAAELEAGASATALTPDT